MQSRIVHRSRMHEMRRRCQIMTGGGSDNGAAPPGQSQSGPPQPQIQPPKSAAEQAAHQAVEVAKKQTLFSSGGTVVKQEPGKASAMGKLHRILLLSHATSSIISISVMLYLLFSLSNCHLCNLSSNPLSKQVLTRTLTKCTPVLANQTSLNSR